VKRAIKERLKRYPFIFSLLRRTYRAFFPASSLDAQLQKQILKNLKQKNTIFFVQVGSNDGFQGDPLHDLIILSKKWKGIFIEPVGFLFDRLRNNYGNSDRFIFEKKAITSNIGVMEFFYVSEKAKSEIGNALPFWYDQLGSFDKNHILRHLNGILEPYILSEQIEAVRLQDICDKHKVTEIDLLHIDTEGYDYKVLSTLDFSKYKPSIILYEHKNLSDVERRSAESLLRKNGYSCITYGIDTLAIIKG
jgi:FkbM family methyltransferase